MKVFHNFRKLMGCSALSSSHVRNNSHSSSGQSIDYPFRFHPELRRDIHGDPFSHEQLFALRNDDGIRQLALEYRHSPREYSKCSNSTHIHPDLRRLVRKLAQIQTINSVLTGSYRLENGQKIELDRHLMLKAAERTKFYPDQYKYKTSRKLYDKTNFYVLNADCLEAALFFKNHYKDCEPVVLNMASMYHPGGGWRNGAGAQEENLHRRTNLFQCLEDPYNQLNRKWPYKVPELGGIYTPNACVFRDSEFDGYPFFSHPQYISFISSAAYKNPSLVKIQQTGEIQLRDEKIIEATKKKIEVVLQIAQENDHDTIILSAFGCGAYGNPAKHIAQLFREVLFGDEKFLNSFRFIVFAIINDHNAYSERNPDGNIQPFADVFNLKILTLNDLKDYPKQQLMGKNTASAVKNLKKSGLDHYFIRKPCSALFSKNEDILLYSTINKKCLQLFLLLENLDEQTLQHHLWMVNLDEKQLELYRHLLNIEKLQDFLTFLHQKLQLKEFDLLKSSADSEINLVFTNLATSKKETVTITLDELSDDIEKLHYTTKLLFYLYKQTEHLSVECKTLQQRVSQLVQAKQIERGDGDGQGKLYESNYHKSTLLKPEQRANMSIINPTSKKRKPAKGVNFGDDD
ncbi:unnamed protein product [Didymodactylos carnosus]|uniref:Microbial-type PARG catalytic domain-containing protein n=1 Tax=Didymodactylos carnosus TaxID=1234261 RepID=A0A813RGU6_9BILA|nr:unnamed protein product [Didymodactylos carnosus]CAF3565441.1 unnamed protein product [Didymodactylos carnosus]